MKYNPMQSVYITSDTLNYGIPVGEQGFIISIDYRVTGLPYFVRVPSKKEEWWIPECDLLASEEWMEQGIDKLIHSSVIDYALKTKNKEMFEKQFKK
jgi:hypothetical protein